MIRTVLRNLLNNAIKYSHNGGEIIISSKKKNNYLEVTIRDNGIGMKKEIKEVIFSKNSMNSKIGTANEIGTGFGLLVCKEFVDAHAGKIRINSGPGLGCEIIFTLPMKTI